MKLIETLKLALAAVWAHKLRSALTLLGMIIGVTHEPDIAARAHRVISIRDGNIEKDEQIR